MVIFSNEIQEPCYWVGKDTLKSWRRMYLELFEYFVNNRDITPNTELPLKPDLMSSVYDTSNHFEGDKFSKSVDGSRSNKMGGITLNSIDECLKLARLFVNNSESIFKILKLNDFKPFHYSLVELESILLEMMNILSSVITRKVNDELANEEKKQGKNNNIAINIKTERTQSESEPKTDDEHKEDDVEDNSQEEKDKHDDSDSLDNKNDTECISWVFNEDIICTHGKLMSTSEIKLVIMILIYVVRNYQYIVIRKLDY